MQGEVILFPAIMVRHDIAAGAERALSKRRPKMTDPILLHRLAPRRDPGPDGDKPRRS